MSSNFRTNFLRPTLKRGLAILGVICVAANTQPALAGSWQIVREADKLADTTSITAALRTTGDDGEHFLVEAKCSPAFVSFTLSTLDGRTTFKQTSTTVGAGIYVRTRLDGRTIHTARSEIQYTNQASLVFYDPDLAPLAVGKARQEAIDPTAKANFFAKMLGDEAATSADAILQITAAGTLEELRSSSILRLQPTLSDGRSPLIQLNLRDPAIGSLLSHCRAQDEAARADLEAHKPIQWFNPGPKAPSGTDPSWATYKNPKQQQLEQERAQQKAEQDRQEAAANAKSAAYERAISDRAFTGTVDQLATALPEYVRKAATAEGVDGSRYQPEIAYIIEHVRTQVKTCMNLTDRSQLRLPTYAVCRDFNVQVSSRANVANAAPGARPLFYNIEFLDPQGRMMMLDGRSRVGTFYVRVTFPRQPSDPIDPDEVSKRHGVVFATLRG